MLKPKSNWIYSQTRGLGVILKLKKKPTQKTVDAKTVFYILILDFEPMSQTFLISYLNIWGKHRSGHWPWLSSSLIQLGEPLKTSLSILNWWMLKG